MLRARARWVACTPEPQYVPTVLASAMPSASAVPVACAAPTAPSMPRSRKRPASSAADKNRPLGSTVLRAGALMAPGMRPATASMVSFSPRNRSAVRASSRTCRAANDAAAVASSRRPKPGLDGEKSPTPGVCGPDPVGWPAAIQAAIPPSSTRTSRKPKCLNIHQSRLAGRDAQSSYATTGRDMATPADRIAAVKVSTVGIG